MGRNGLSHGPVEDVLVVWESHENVNARVAHATHGCSRDLDFMHFGVAIDAATDETSPDLFDGIASSPNPVVCAHYNECSLRQHPDPG